MPSNLNCSIAMEDSNRVELVFGEEIVAASKCKPRAALNLNSGKNDPVSVDLWLLTLAQIIYRLLSHISLCSIAITKSLHRQHPGSRIRVMMKVCGDNFV